ncbi:MAG: polyprenyl synthetase family protein [Acidobacteria bacterium]|nr:MAG: polyprenyl synthetase family protein [Acidobacteriota bacterium]
MTGEGAPGSLAGYLSDRRAEVEEALLRVLPAEGTVPEELTGAMRYAVLAGGKRLRPILCLAVSEALAAPGSHLPPRESLCEAACALELIHTYSLVHDDLPAMDDDALRRGKPTCHVVYGEATALLAGDTLQTLGFEVLATRPPGDRWGLVRARAVALSARAIGVEGMAGGQALDLSETGHGHEPERAAARLREVHARKTGRLLAVAVELGALYAGSGEDLLSAARTYGEALGLVFQIADDLLDVTSDAATLGKTAGKDARQDKLTYPSVFGLEGARRERERALAAALTAASALEPGEGRLAALARFAAHRDR